MTRLLTICLSPLLAASMLLMSLTGCGNGFDVNREAIVEVVTGGSLPEEGITADDHYYAIACDGHVRETEPFEPDSIVIYQNGSGPANETIAGILMQLGALEHEVCFCEIFEAGGEYFPYVELNVNWWSPCVLYHYDREKDALVELNTWDGERVVGLRTLGPGASGA